MSVATGLKVKLTNFEGPLDLLLFFVRKDELNIYDIPISYITKQYLEYLQLMKDLNLDIAAEFILMAATLMRIKVRSLLPPDPLQEEEEEILDPREELTRRLIEYRQFKEASKSLGELDDYWRSVYRRSYFNFDLLPQQEDGAVGLKDISFFDLLAAYKKAVARKPKPIFHQVERLNVTVEGQTKVIQDFFQGRTCYLFGDLCESMGKIEIVVTFLAMLDMIKKGELAVKQASLFEDIWIYKAEEFFEEDPPEMPELITGNSSDTTTSDETRVDATPEGMERSQTYETSDPVDLLKGSEMPEPLTDEIGTVEDPDIEDTAPVTHAPYETANLAGEGDFKTDRKELEVATVSEEEAHEVPAEQRREFNIVNVPATTGVERQESALAAEERIDTIAEQPRSPDVSQESSDDLPVNETSTEAGVVLEHSPSGAEENRIATEQERDSREQIIVPESDCVQVTPPEITGNDMTETSSSGTRCEAVGTSDERTEDTEQAVSPLRRFFGKIVSLVKRILFR